MEYNYNRILEDIRQLVNKSVLIWLGIMAGMSFLISILCVVDVLPTEVLWSLLGIIPSAIILILVVAYYH
ncbi:MAG: hypothetical protein K2N90_11835, partial [Lachnospiraceae bacterium]|nr:hypothetical protein [Lachnospiraceae bacterium]